MMPTQAHPSLSTRHRIRTEPEQNQTNYRCYTCFSQDHPKIDFRLAKSKRMARKILPEGRVLYVASHHITFSLSFFASLVLLHGMPSHWTIHLVKYESMQFSVSVFYSFCYLRRYNFFLQLKYGWWCFVVGTHVWEEMWCNALYDIFSVGLFREFFLFEMYH